MRWLTWAVVVAAVLWSGYWFAGSTALDRGVREAFAGATRQGALATHAGLGVSGFPNRFDLTVTRPRLGDPVTGIAWSAPFVQVFTMTWQPWHIIAALPSEQVIVTPGAEATLTSDRLRASVVFMPRPALPLDRMTLAGEGLALDLAPLEAAPARLTLERAQLSTRLDPSRANTHEVALDLAGLAPGPGFRAALPPGTDLPDRADTAGLRAFVTFSAPLDRHAGTTRPTITALDLREARLAWGAIALSAQGSIAADDAGLAAGRIDIRLDGWETALAAATAAGLVRPEIAPTWAEFARRLSELSAPPGTSPGTVQDRLDLPLTFANGRMSLGPLPLGPAPRLIPAPQG